MKEFIEKLIEKLNDRMEYLDSRHKILTDAGLFKESDKIADKMVEVDFIKQIVNQLAEEYNNGNDSMEIQIAKNYAKWITKCGVDVTEKWETATQNAAVLENAYLRGRQDERDKFAEWQDNNGWIPCSERLPDKYCHCLVTRRNDYEDGSFDSDVREDVWIELEGVWGWQSKFEGLIDEVIAWQPLPDTYIPKQEEQKG